jgi:hypothetical protein
MAFASDPMFTVRMAVVTLFIASAVASYYCKRCGCYVVSRRMIEEGR